jgi:hypothetical protein
MLHRAMRKGDKHEDIIFFELDFLPRDGVSYRIKFTKLKAVINVDDLFEPVITIMLANEG